MIDQANTKDSNKMNVHQGMLELWEEFKKSKWQIIGITITWAFLFTLIFFLSILNEGLIDQWRLSTKDPISLFITSLTSLFLHSDYIHLSSNLVMFLIFSPFFFTLQRNYLKGTFWLLMTRYIVHLVEFIFHNFITILIRLSESFYYDIYGQKVSVFIFPLKSVGASGMIAGMIMYVCYALFLLEGKKQWLYTIHRRNSPLTHDCYLIIMVIGCLTLILAGINDLSNFIAVYGELIQYLIINSVILDFAFSEGNPYMAHVIGVSIGLFISIKDRKQYWKEIVED